MLKNLKETIRAVPIAGKTYEEYVENLAEQLNEAGYRKASEVVLEALDDFQRTIRHIFLAMCNGNDYNTLNLLQIDSAIESLFDNKLAELKKKYTEGEGWKY